MASVIQIPNQPNPTLTVMQIANQFANVRGQNERRQLMQSQQQQIAQNIQNQQRQLAFQSQMAPYQQQFLEERAKAQALQNAANQHQAALIQEYPMLASKSPQAQTIGVLQMISDQKRAQEQQNAAAQPESESPTQSLVPSLTAPTTQPMQPVSPQHATPVSPSDPAKLSPADYANNFVKGFYNKFRVPSASDLGLKMGTTGLQTMADNLIASQFQKSYGSVLEDTLPARMWQSLPADEKNAALGGARGLGLTGTLANQYFASGGTLENLAKQANIPLSYIKRVYAPTSTTRSREQLAQLAGNAAKSIENDVTSYVAPYATKNIMGINNKEVENLLAGKNPDSIANYLAAQMVQPELALLQLRRSGGNVTNETISMMLSRQQAMQNRVQSFLQSRYITPKIYTEAMNKFNELSNRAMDAQKQYIQSTGLTKFEPSQGQLMVNMLSGQSYQGIGARVPQSSSNIVRMKAPNGKIYSVPQNQVDEYKKIGGTIVNG